MTIRITTGQIIWLEAHSYYSVFYWKEMYRRRYFDSYYTLEGQAMDIIEWLFNHCVEKTPKQFFRFESRAK